VEHRPLAGDRVGRSGRAVQACAQPVQGSPDDARIAELADRQRYTSSQASVLTVTGSGARDRRGTLKAYPYKAARSVPSGGLQPVSLVSNGVTVASASAKLARECGARCGHFICAYATACWYQVTVTGSGAAHAVGSPVAGSNPAPLRAARTSSAR
jgi:hypothetical protein